MRLEGCGTGVRTWFETLLRRLLTMRIGSNIPMFPPNASSA